MKKQLQDTTAPIITELLPKGELSGEIKEVKLQVFTNEIAECRYNVADQSFEQMSKFSQTNSLEHTSSIAVQEDTEYRYYVRCSDLAGNKNIMSGLVAFKV